MLETAYKVREKQIAKVAAPCTQETLISQTQEDPDASNRALLTSKTRKIIEGWVSYGIDPLPVSDCHVGDIERALLTPDGIANGQNPGSMVYRYRNIPLA